MPRNVLLPLLMHFCSVCLVVPALVAFFIHPVLFIVFRNSDTSLSNMCFLVIIPDLRSLSIIFQYARMSSSSLQFLMGLTSIALLSISAITMIYLFPCCECVGNCPIWSNNTAFLTLYTLAYTSCTLCPCSVHFLGTSRGVRLGLLDLTFFLDWFRCTFGVSLVSW